MATKKHSSHKKSLKYQSFRVYKDTVPFIQFNITEQTVFWSILLIFIMIIVLWVLSIQLDIDRILNSIEVLQ